MKKLQKIRIIESPRTDLPLTMNEMLNVEGGAVCDNTYITMDICSGYRPTCESFNEYGTCNGSVMLTYCSDHTVCPIKYDPDKESIL